MTVNGIKAHKFIMGTGFHNSAAVYDQNLVGVSDGGKTVGNGKDGTVFHSLVEGVLNQSFGDRIKGAGGLVKDENGGIAHW